MLSDRQKIDYAKSKLYRQYIINPEDPDDIDGLIALADTVYATATDIVTLNQSGFEGANQSGIITFEKAIIGVAIEELLKTYDPSYIPPTESRVIEPDWRFSTPV